MSPILDRRQILTGGAAIAGLSLGSTGAFAQNDRIESLIAKMTSAEKAGQLSCFSDQIRPIGVPFNPGLATGGAAEQIARIKTGQIGMLFNGVGYAGAKAAQDAAMATRLKIPLIFAGDVIHGLRTAYPLPIAEACAFDPDLAERTARAAALETTARGIHWTFAPMVDVARDQRWGRVAEGSGEDPYLGIQLAKARIRGFQGTTFAIRPALRPAPSISPHTARSRAARITISRRYRPPRCTRSISRRSRRRSMQASRR